VNVTAPSPSEITDGGDLLKGLNDSATTNG